jgi:putative addiction module component (TIGR02574 family)
MSSAAKKVLADALALSESDREALVEVLLTSLKLGSPGEVEAAWSEEVMQRLDRLQNGESAPVDWDEARRRIREKFGFE